eukprot:scaffold508_cov554-Prasinococcus_capsulatus_cf.AAC.9
MYSPVHPPPGALRPTIPLNERAVGMHASGATAAQGLRRVRVRVRPGPAAPVAGILFAKNHTDSLRGLLPEGLERRGP